MEEGKRDDVGIYTCGPTVYSEPHVGNMKPYVFADLLRWVIRYVLGYPVTHVVNITDVGHLVNDESDSGEDKMEKWSRREWLTAWEVAKKYESHFRAYLEALHIDPFDHMPRATAYIQEQIDIVKQLIEGWYTYVIPGDGIYMNTSRVEDYGKLLWPSAEQHLAGLHAGARIEDTGKKNPTDFALRKFSPKWEKRQMERLFDGPRAGLLLDEKNISTLTAEEEQTRGFPGRHIECSAMSRACLWEHFDIHTGGVDHIPIHHTDEIAQSECSFSKGETWVKYRLHVQFLNIDGKKVSKSAGDDLSLPGVQEHWCDALDLRYLLLTGQYRNFLDFTREHLRAAQQARKSIIQKCATYVKDQLNGTYNRAYFLEQVDILWANAESSNSDTNSQNSVYTFHLAVQDALLDDLNTPQVLALFHAWVGELSMPLLADILWWDTYVTKIGIHEGIEKYLSFSVPAEIEGLAQERLVAKQQKQFARADELRQQIQDAWYELKDTRDGYEILPT